MRGRHDLFKLTRAGFALLSFGFNLVIFFAVAQPEWVAANGWEELAWIWISALVMGGASAVMSAVEV